MTERNPDPEKLNGIVKSLENTIKTTTKSSYMIDELGFPNTAKRKFRKAMFLVDVAIALRENPSEESDS